ncbi:MAG: hypothetical protein WBH85_04285 [Thermoanaerobaculia bacterium]
MMGRALLMIGWLAALGLLIAGFHGYVVDGTDGLSRHVLLALLASLLLLFSHCWILFYLIGTGKVIKGAVVEHGLDPAIVDQTRDFKNQTSSWLLLAMILAIATFVLGGAVVTKTVPAWAHQVLFYVTVLVQIVTLRRETRVLIANERLISDINRRVSA